MREAEAVLRVIESLKEEKALVGATDIEREKANALRQAGSAATAEQRAEIESLVEAIYREKEATEAATEASQELRDIGKDVLGGMISDLRAGKTASEALADALNKVADKLLEIALNALFDGSGGGWLGAVAGALGFAKGGYTGDGPRNKPAGVVHRGEYVFSKAATDKIGAGNLETLHRGYAAGGLVSAMPRMATPRIMPSANQNRPQEITVRVIGEEGPMFRPTIRAESQGVAVKVVQAGIGRYDKTLPGKMPGLIASAQSRRL